ncbi:MAG: molybdenum cofactor guanylyltransferase [Nitrospinota bacterium]
MNDITGIVLAGGRSRRFGSNKALATWESGLTLVETIVKKVALLFPEVLVLVKDIESYNFLEREGVQVAPDLYPDFHSLGGIYTGLSLATTPYVFVCACDMPFIKPGLVQAITKKRAQYDAVIPRYKDTLQPLCGVYSKKCLTPIQKMIDGRQFQIIKLFEKINSHFIVGEETNRLDKNGQSFLDIDTIDDFVRAKKLTTRW